MRTNQKKGISLTITAIVILAVLAIAFAAYTFTIRQKQNINSASRTKMFADVSSSIIVGGSTFISPQMQVWIRNFESEHPKISIVYNSVGSGAGISQFIQGTYDVGATDVPMPTDTWKQAVSKYGTILTLPEILGGVAVIYNIPSFNGILNLTSNVLAGIFSGDIQYWDDSAIQNLNPSFKLAHERIVVVHRSDGSGTTFYFTLWLSKNNRIWNSTIGTGFTVSWPVDKLGNGLGGKGSAGVTASVSQNQWSIGYVEVQYAIASNLSVASIENPTTMQFVKPDQRSLSIAISSVKLTDLPSINEDWYPYSRLFLDVNADGAYPITGFSFLHFKASYSDLNKALATYAFLVYILTIGQSYVSVGYLALPKSLAERLIMQLGDEMNYGGKAVTSVISR